MLRQPVFREPGSRGFITQSSLFGRGIGGSRSIELDISGEDLEEIIGIAQRADELIAEVLPRSGGTQVRPQPGLELGAPEIRVIPNLNRVSEARMTARDLATTVDAFNDGIRVAEISIGGRRLDLTLQGPVANISQTQGVSDLPVVTPSGDIVPVSSLADVMFTAGPTEIRHKDRARTITLQIRPDDKLPLETAVSMIQTEVMDKLRAEGLPDDVKLYLSGAADDLSATWEALQYSLLIAIVIVYLVIAILFESFVYPLIIMLSVPLATAGGIGGLAVLNTILYQPLDMLTMLGFIILVGIVVNNAILLVDQSLYLYREEGRSAPQAIRDATMQRVRPIFMSSLTSIFGLLPLVFVPGAGSELYRGLGSVVLGGLTLSAILTLLVIPPLMGLFLTRKVPDARQIEATGGSPLPQGADD
jgi:HAE1 family hydrophobic/amphiphilic exporter-1